MRTLLKKRIAFAVSAICLSSVLVAHADGRQTNLGSLLVNCLHNRNGDACYDLVVGYGNTIVVASRSETIVPLVLASRKYRTNITAPAVSCKPESPKKSCGHPAISECLKFPSGEPWKIWQRATNGYVECCFVNCLVCDSTIVGRCEPVDVSKIPERVMYQLMRTGSGF